MSAAVRFNGHLADLPRSMRDRINRAIGGVRIHVPGFGTRRADRVDRHDDRIMYRAAGEVHRLPRGAVLEWDDAAVEPLIPLHLRIELRYRVRSRLHPHTISH